MISDYYDQTFTVESPTTATSGIGSWNPSWSEAGTIIGFLDYLAGQERFIASQFVGKATHVLGCSSTCSWITSRDRIKDSDDYIYRILNVDNPIKRDHHLEILLEYNETDNLST